MTISILDLFKPEEIQEKADGNYKTICPDCGMQGGRTEGLIIFPESNSWYCHSSGKHGRVLELVALQHKIISCNECNETGEVKRVMGDGLYNEVVDILKENYSEEAYKGIMNIANSVLDDDILLDGNGRSISDLCRDIASLLENKNILFYRPNSRQIVEVGKIKLHNTGENVYTGFRNIKDKRLITLIEKYVRVGQMVKMKDYGEFFAVKSLSPNKADIVLCSEILEQSLPQIERIFPTPIPIMYNGKLTFAKKGFDKRFSSWTPIDAPEIEDEKMNIKKAKEILNTLFSEFCFASKQDKTNAIAALLTPFLRGLFEDYNTRTPVFFYMGNRERVGKDYCAGITGITYDGQAIDDNPISSGDSSNNNNEELRKKITAALIGGRKRMHFANNKGYINNAIIEQVSTSKIYSDRLLGKNEIVNLPNEMDFSLSGNVGITYTPDFANRCRFVNFFLDLEDANSRKFTTPLLHEWVKKNRGVLLSALYSLVRNWIDKGKKNGSVPFASFPNWASVCGGIMESAGYLSPCNIDKKSISLAGDSETADMKQLFEICFEQFPDKPLKKNDVVKIAEEENLFSYLNFDERSGKTNFGIKLRRFIGRILSDIQLTVADTSVRVPRQEFLFKKHDISQKMGVGMVGMVGILSPMSDYSTNKIYIRVEKGAKDTKDTKSIKPKTDREVQFYDAEECKSIKPNHTKEDVLKFYKDNPKADYKQLYEKFGVGCLKFRNELKQEGLI